MWAIGFIAVVATACGTMSDPPAPAPDPWDQAKVTGLTQELAAAGNAWWKSLIAQPESDTLGSGDSTFYDAMLRKSQVLSEQSQALAGHLAAGKGRAETRDMYRTLKENADDTQVDVERVELDQPAQDVWNKFKGTMDELAPYYGTRDVGP
jgi:hypothetical protein